MQIVYMKIPLCLPNFSGWEMRRYMRAKPKAKTMEFVRHANGLRLKPD